MKRTKAIVIATLAALLLVGCSTSIDTKYEVVKEVDIDSVPIDIGDKGFVMHEDDAFYFLYPDGSTLYEEKGFTSYADIGTESLSEVCFYSTFESVSLDGKSCTFGLELFETFTWKDEFSQSYIALYDNGELIEQPVEEYFTEHSSQLDGRYNMKQFMSLNELPEQISRFDMSMLFETLAPIPVVITDNLVTRVNQERYDDFAVLTSKRAFDFMIFNGVEPLEKLNAVKQGNKWALMNQNAELISGYEYDFIRMLSREYFFFEKDGYSGVINSNGEVKLIGKFEDASGIIGNMAFIKKDGKWFEIRIID